jgi:hypothetical protein
MPLPLPLPAIVRPMAVARQRQWQGRPAAARRVRLRGWCGRVQQLVRLVAVAACCACAVRGYRHRPAAGGVGSRWRSVLAAKQEELRHPALAHALPARAARFRAGQEPAWMLAT